MKLNKKMRDILPDSEFGIPENRSYPLNDKNHVIKAVQFFRYVPADKKKILADNINRKAKQLGMKLSVKEDSPFYKYADKSILRESNEYLLMENSYAFDISAFRYGVDEFLNKIQSKIIKNEEDLLNLEYDIQRNANDMINKYMVDVNNNLHKMNLFRIINILMREKYYEFIEAMSYIKSDYNILEKLKYDKLIRATLADILNILRSEIHNNPTDPINIDTKIKMIYDIDKSFMLNSFLVRRIGYELMNEIKILQSDKVNVYNHVKKLIVEKLCNFPMNQPVMLFMFHEKHEDILKYDIKYNQTKDFLRSLKSECEMDISNILVNLNIHNGVRESDILSHNTRGVLELVGDENYQIINVIQSCDSSIKDSYLSRYNKDYCFSLDAKDLLFITEKLNKYCNVLVCLKTLEGNPVYLGVTKETVNILGKDKSNGNLLVMPIYDISDTDIFVFNNNNERANIIKITPIVKDYKTPTLEGMFINKDGDITIKFKKNKTYMDTYDEAHKKIKSNWSMKNYNAVKKDLAYMFTLIMELERIVHSNKKVPKDKKDDIMKAKMFASNDFKTYITKLKDIDEDFDFTEYYENHDYDKTVFTISKDAVIGVRKLFQAIMVG